MRRLRWTAAALTVAALALPAAAGATTASINGNAIVINDPQGITDHLTIAPGGPTPAPVTIDGGTENDMIDASGRSSADVINGGAGTDTVTYANRATAVTVTLDDVANDGFHGSSTVENDNVHTDVENITGSPASDALTGDAAANVLSGLGGNDRIDALAGDDTMLGGAGDDTIGPLPPTVGTPICFTNP